MTKVEVSLARGGRFLLCCATGVRPTLPTLRRSLPVSHVAAMVLRCGFGLRSFRARLTLQPKSRPTRRAAPEHRRGAFIMYVDVVSLALVGLTHRLDAA